MGKRNEYDPQTKAAVIGALLEGQAVSKVAETYNIPEGTIASWKSRARETLGDGAIATEKKAEIGDLLLDYLRESLATLRSQVQFFRDPDWLKKQGAAELATLHGVTTDKAVRLLEAMSPPDAGTAAE